MASQSLYIIFLIIMFNVAHCPALRLFDKFRPHRPMYPTYNQQNIGVPQEDIEWICTNPKTKDQMIIASETRFGGAPDPQKWTQSSYPQQQPPANYPQQQPLANYPQQQPPMNYPQQQPQVNPQPIYVQAVNPQTDGSSGPQVNTYYETTPMPNNMPNNNPNVEIITEPPGKKEKHSLNTDGDGLIDIRMGK